ncbi:hypothetical protein OTSSIDO_0668 [Orientia tsutsugamushi str. Sido]|nr:hypothetical protein OTSSIDO_0668 [Orientia tsutsugamushi str. Sido]
MLIKNLKVINNHMKFMNYITAVLLLRLLNTAIVSKKQSAHTTEN